MVRPVSFWPVAAAEVHVDLRCPDCEAEWGGVYPPEAIERLLLEFDRGMGQIAIALERMTRANMAEVADLLAAALEADALLPMDF
jgi:hypothetical protein